MFSSATVSVLVNGSPSQEFHMFRGLRHGDPLSPFLFVLTMEGLHVALTSAHLANTYSGITIGGITISHLLYVDDIVLMADWDHENALHIICILCCFFLASGLKINLLKSKFYGVGVSANQVSSMDNCMRCSMGSFLFIHLGVPIGQNMAKVDSLGPINYSFGNKFDVWKAKYLSFDTKKRQKRYIDTSQHILTSTKLMILYHGIT